MRDRERKTENYKEFIKNDEEDIKDFKYNKQNRFTIAKLKDIDVKNDKGISSKNRFKKKKFEAKPEKIPDDLFNQGHKIFLNSKIKIKEIKKEILNKMKFKKNLKIESKIIKNFKNSINEFLQIKNFILISKDDEIIKVDENNKNSILIKNPKTEKIKCFCYLEEENTIFFGSRDFSIKTYNFETKKIEIFAKHKEIYDLKISENGNLLYSKSTEGILKIWKIPKKAKSPEKKRDEKRKPISIFQIKPKILKNKLSIKKLQQKQQKTQKKIISPIIMLKNQLFFIEEKTIQKKTLKKGSKSKIIGIHRKRILTIILSKDKKSIISGGADCLIKIWDIINPENSKILTVNDSSVWCLIQSENEKWLFSGDNKGCVKIWDMENLCEIGVFGHHKVLVKKLVFSENEDFLFSVCKFNFVKKWDLRKNREIGFFENKAVVSCLSVCEGFLYSGGNDGFIKIWDFKRNNKAFLENKKRRSLISQVCVKDFAKNFEKLGSDEKVDDEKDDSDSDFDEEFIDREKIENEKNEKYDMDKKNANCKILGKHEICIRAICISNSKRYLYSGSKDKTIKIFDIQKNAEIGILGKHENEITCLCISKTDKYLYSGSVDKTIKIWDLEKKSEIGIFKKHKHFIKCLIISKDGKYLFSGSWDRTIKIWDLEKNEFLQDLGKHENYVTCFCISENGDILFSGSKDNSIKIWDLNFFQEIGILDKSKFDVNSLVCSKNGDFLFSVHSDFSVKIWDLKNFVEIGVLGKHEENIICLEISEKKDLLFSGSKDGTIKIWDLKKILFCDKLFLESTVLNSDVHLDEDLFLEKIKCFEGYFDSMLFLRVYYNPIMICVLFEFSKALEYILTNNLFLYSQSNNYQISPLILAFRIKNIDIINILLAHLKKPKYTSSLTYKEMYFLLENENALIDDFLSYLPKKIKKFSNKNEYIPPQTNIEETELIYNEYKNFCNFHFTSWLSKRKIPKASKNSKNTIYYNFDFNFHFIQGSKESRIFLKKYKNSKNSKFILSPFRHIINYKWAKIKKFFLILSIIYWSHLIIFSIYIVNPKQFIFLIFDICIITVLFLHELTSYFLNKKLYFQELTNFLDITMILLSIICLISTLLSENINNTLLSYVQMVSTSVVYFRGFLYLEVFDSFRHLINMIIGVTNSIFTTLFVFAYILLAFTVLFTKSLGNYSFIESLKINFNSIFGNLPEDGDDFVLDFSVWVLVISIGIITTLILSNFLIAVMSSRYAELELEQTIISLKGKADMVEEIEVFLRAFEKYKKSKNRKFGEIGNFLSRNFLVIMTNDFDVNDSKINMIKKKSKSNKDKDLVKKQIGAIKHFLELKKKEDLKKDIKRNQIVEELKEKLDMTNLKIEDLRIQNDQLKIFYEEKIVCIEKQNDLKKYQIDEIREMIFEILEKKDNLSLDVKSHYEKSILKMDGDVKIDNKLRNFQSDMVDKFENIEGKMGIILDFMIKNKNNFDNDNKFGNTYNNRNSYDDKFGNTYETNHFENNSKFGKKNKNYDTRNFEEDDKEDDKFEIKYKIYENNQYQDVKNDENYENNEDYEKFKNYQDDDDKFVNNKKIEKNFDNEDDYKLKKKYKNEEKNFKDHNLKERISHKTNNEDEIVFDEEISLKKKNIEEIDFDKDNENKQKKNNFVY